MIKNRLKEQRNNKGLSQKALAEILNVSQQTIGSWETGRTEPDQKSLKKIAEFFNVSVDYLIGNSNNLSNNISGTFTPTLTKKDEKDIAKKLEEIINDMNSSDGLMLYNNDLDDETKELLIASLERTLRQAKLIAKEKFTPLKYRK